MYQLDERSQQISELESRLDSLQTKLEARVDRLEQNPVSRRSVSPPLVDQAKQSPIKVEDHQIDMDKLMGLVTAEINRAKLELERSLQVELRDSKGSQQNMQMAVASVDNQQQGMQARIRSIEDRIQAINSSLQEMSLSSNQNLNSKQWSLRSRNVNYFRSRDGLPKQIEREHPQSEQPASVTSDQLGFHRQAPAGSSRNGHALSCSHSETSQTD